MRLLHSIEQGLRESLPETDGGTHTHTHINTHGFQDRSDEPGGKTGGKLQLTIDGRCMDTSGKVVEFPLLTAEKNSANIPHDRFPVAQQVRSL
ncbi:hypothetical protein [Propionivibrio sp.]|uniref:hypothetical protein n=1 Tax=Propionivibrio sp. TaxID=2212460 RepID=UPI003BF42865